MRENNSFISQATSIDHDDANVMKLQSLADRGISHLQQLQQSFAKLLQQSCITEEKIQTATTYLIMSGEHATVGLCILQTKEDLLAHKRMNVVITDLTVQNFQYVSNILE